MDTFQPNRALLNPKFEGYKLDPVSQEEIVVRFPLQFKPTQATVSGKSPLSFQEVQSRITHNHLATCAESQRAMIHTAHASSASVIFAILSSRHYEVEPGPESQHKGQRAAPATFDIWGVKIEIDGLTPARLREMEVLWHRRGQDVPIYAAFVGSLQASLLIGGSTFQDVGTVKTPVYEPSLDEIAPIPRANEKFDVEPAEPLRPPPYSWTQTSDSITMAIPLPSSTPKSTIKVMFSPQTLTVHTDYEISSSVPVPRYSTKKLWDGISASTSYWTWDREAEHSFGLLTLYLDKQHEGRKWTQVFASTGDPEEVEVLETLDPSELWHIREALEKYTNSLRDGDDASGLGLGRGVPSLAEGELDMEVDEAVGRKAYLSWVGDSGAAPEWWKNPEEIPFQLLSTPVPGGDDAMSVIVKNNLDGTVHSLNTQNTKSPVWTHTSTFSALSFVLASKQDTRFTFHTSNAVFAFEGGIWDRGGNVYVYRSASPTAKWAKQAILKVGDGYGGSLLGVGALKVMSTTVLLCLAEGELVVIKNP
ncbi:hypothetical protein H0H87_009028 [Tephrocybe sp. NHM501043]|nr:hypothetical protein H0H87_009028 [Tephrocybe sp. NHM501043]